MTKKDLVKVIRKLVREEVKKEVGKILISERKVKTIPQKKSKPIKKTLSKDKTLNEVLNETEGGIANEEYPSMGGETYTTEKMGEVLGSAYSNLGNDTSNPNGALAAEMGVNPEEPGMEFLKKDFRAVMKAVDRKKAGGPLKGA